MADHSLFKNTAEEGWLKMGQHSNHHDFSKRAQDFFLTPTSTAQGAVVFCIVLGILSLIVGAVTKSAEHVWAAVLLNTFFFYSLSLGGIAFSAMQDVVDAVWARPIKRLHESFSSFLPYGTVILILFLICVSFEFASAHRVYSWIYDDHIIHEVHNMFGKNVWLNKNFMVIRNIAALLIIWALANWQLGFGIRRDKALVENRLDDAKKLGVEAHEKLKYWSAPVLIGYAVCFSLLTFDLIMSLSPLWFSTLWAGWMFAIMMQVLCASLLLFMFSTKDSKIGNCITRQQFHDVGKLLHGFTIFFAYLTYAHVLTYWYGNVPEETHYFLMRMDPNSPWLKFILIIPVLAFLIPFFTLIFKVSKWTSYITIPLCFGVILAQWMSTMITVIPEVVDGKNWSFPVLEFGLFLGVAGLFVQAVLRFGKVHPMLPVADPLLPEAYEGH